MRKQGNVNQLSFWRQKTRFLDSRCDVQTGERAIHCFYSNSTIFQSHIGHQKSCVGTCTSATIRKRQSFDEHIDAVSQSGIKPTPSKPMHKEQADFPHCRSHEREAYTKEMYLLFPPGCLSVSCPWARECVRSRSWREWCPCRPCRGRTRGCRCHSHGGHRHRLSGRRLRRSGRPLASSTASSSLAADFGQLHKSVYDHITVEQKFYGLQESNSLRAACQSICFGHGETRRGLRRIRVSWILRLCLMITRAMNFLHCF